MINEQMLRCKNCGERIDSPRKNLSMPIDLFRIGKSIYLRVLDCDFKSIELCNFCYSVMQSYRNTLSKEERNDYEKPYYS